MLTNSPVLLPLSHALLKLREKEVMVEFVDGLDIRKHLGDDVSWEEVVCSVLLVDPELELLVI